MLVFDPGGRRSRSNVRILIGKQRSGPARVAECLNSRKPVRKKERAALRRPYTDVSRRRRSDRQRSTLRVPAGRGVAKAGKPNHHHRPGRRLWSAASLVYGGRNKAELERIGGRGERRSREKTKSGNRNQLVARRIELIAGARHRPHPHRHQIRAGQSIVAMVTANEFILKGLPSIEPQ